MASVLGLLARTKRAPAECRGLGGETWSRVVSVELASRQGEVVRLGPADFRVGYREVEGSPGRRSAGGGP